MSRVRGAALLEFTEKDDAIELVSPMPRGRRIMFALLALFPLIAPYELLVRPRWESWLHPAFFFVLIISLGAMAVSAFLLFAALAGLTQRMRFDASTGVFTYWRHAPILPEKSASWPFASIESVSAVVHTWSDGPDSYSVRVIIAEGPEFTTGSTESRIDVDRYVARVEGLLKTAVAGGLGEAHNEPA